MTYVMDELPRCHYCNNGQVPMYYSSVDGPPHRTIIIGWTDCHFCGGEGIYPCRPPQPVDPQPKE